MIDTEVLPFRLRYQLIKLLVHLSEPLALTSNLHSEVGANLLLIERDLCLDLLSFYFQLFQL